MGSDYEWTLAPDGVPMGIANWDAISNAIQAQVVAASGLAANRVIWHTQGRDRPDGATSFITLEIVGAIESMGSVTPQQTTDDNPDSTGDDGFEIILKSEEPINFQVRINYYMGKKFGKRAAWARLSTVCRFLNAESTADELLSSGVAIVDTGTVQNLTTAFETEFESRAVVDLSFATVDGFEEATTYIETAEIQTEILEPDGTPMVYDNPASIEIQPHTLTIGYAEEADLIAIGHYADGRAVDITQSVVWGSIGGSGTVVFAPFPGNKPNHIYASHAGTAVINCSYRDALSPDFSITITP